jgi:hypothetical protein
MRPRTEAFIGFGALTVLAALAAVGGRARAPEAATVDDLDPSTFLTDPGGARGLLEATQRMGIDVLRFRGRPAALDSLTDRPRQLLAIIGPTAPVSPPDVTLLLRFHRSSDLLLAGKSAENVMRCFGYKVDRRLFDSVRTDGMQATAPFAHATLVATNHAVFTDSSRRADVGDVRCQVPAYRSVHTVLGSPRGPVVMRLEEPSGRQVILVADAALLSNHALRDSDAGPLALSLFAGRYDHVVFDEYHHGWGAEGSLAAATLAWSLRSPWGWVAWQLIGVGVLALLSGAIRFGPAMPAFSRTRRSPLEHVRALATALAAARGHDEAVAAIVRGLRRRLAPPALRSRGDWRNWLAQRDRRTASPAEREALVTLTSLTQPGQPSSSVLLAANAVEDLWQSLQH